MWCLSSSLISLYARWRTSSAAECAYRQRAWRPSYQPVCILFHIGPHGISTTIMSWQSGVQRPANLPTVFHTGPPSSMTESHIFVFWLMVLATIWSMVLSWSSGRRGRVAPHGASSSRMFSIWSTGHAAGPPGGALCVGGGGGGNGGGGGGGGGGGSRGGGGNLHLLQILIDTFQVNYFQ